MSSDRIVWNVPGAGSYVGCSHSGCKKKASDSITDHDCCGKCSSSRGHLQAALASYSGPGTFRHDYWETLMQPGTCGTCGEARQAH